MKGSGSTYRADILFSSIFSIMVIYLLGQVTVNMNVFDPFKRAFQDFKYTDIYYSKIRKTDNSIFPQIILVNIGKLRRSELAKEIEIIKAYKPRVIGIDVTFPGRKDWQGDSLLATVINNSDQVVLATEYRIFDERYHRFLGQQKSFLQLRPGANGYTNIVGEDHYSGTVRNFLSNFRNATDTVFSFAATVAIQFKPSLKQDILKHNNFQTIIYSASLENFITLDSWEVFNHSEKLDLVKDRIVLMGYLGEPFLSPTDIEDKHFTPLNEKISGRSLPDMYGVVINANIILMLLDGVHLHQVWGWANALISFLLISLHIACFIYLYVYYHKWYHVSTKIIQLISSVLILLIVFTGYHYLHLYFDPTLSVIVILFAVDLLYFYEGLVRFISKWVKIRSAFIKS